MSDLLADLTTLLRQWEPAEAQQADLLARYRGFAAEHGEAALAKSGGPVHFTASLLPFSADLDRVLLVHHAKALRWLQPGGHIEAGDASIAAAARREGVEECGIPLDAELVPAELDAHLLGGRFSCAEHLDIRFAVRVPEEAAPRVSAESLDVRWFAVDDPVVRSGVGLLVDRALRVLRPL